MSTPRNLEQDCQVLLEVAWEVLTGLSAALYQAGGDQLGVLLGEVDALAAAHGRVERFSTRTQRRAVWRRDKTCTYPGCGAPGTWTEVHHVHHWVDGGRSDMNNAALLCQRHHTHVHTRRLWADIRDTPDDTGRHVHRDLTQGSHDREHHRNNGTTPSTSA